MKTSVGVSCLFQAEEGIRDIGVTGVQTCALPILDRCKQINDRYGHSGGDEALRLIAGALTSRVRAGDVVARLGGDELAVLLPGTDLGRAVALAEQLRVPALQLGLPDAGPGERKGKRLNSR